MTLIRGGTAGVVNTSGVLMRFSSLGMALLQLSHARSQFIHFGHPGERSEGADKGGTLARRQLSR